MRADRLVFEALALRAAPSSKPAEPEKTKAPRPKKKPAKIDPQFVAASRELRDRYLEQLNTLDVVGQGKYDVSRVLPAAASVAARDVALLPLAA